MNPLASPESLDGIENLPVFTFIEAERWCSFRMRSPLIKAEGDHWLLRDSRNTPLHTITPYLPKALVHRVFADKAGLIALDDRRRRKNVCGNTLCVNPYHWENPKGRPHKGRPAYEGVDGKDERRERWRARLTLDERDDIRVRLANGERNKDVAAAFGVTESTTSAIRHYLGSYRYDLRKD